MLPSSQLHGYWRELTGHRETSGARAACKHASPTKQHIKATEIVFHSFMINFMQSSVISHLLLAAHALSQQHKQASQGDIAGVFRVPPDT